MYIDLLLGLVMDNNNFCEYSPEELLVQIAKLKMYYDEMIVLKNEIILRLIALKEIKKEKIEIEIPSDIVKEGKPITIIKTNDRK